MVVVLATLALLALVRGQEQAASTTCELALQTWIREQAELFPIGRPVDSNKLLYFLHVPRTAGRTTHSCLLRPGSRPSRRCAKSYDGFKYNISIPDCGLFASHDDYSAMRFLPKESAVITSIRNPVDRFLSAYEFAAELGARPGQRPGQPVRPDRVSTQNVWPWSYLQPMFFGDISAKREKRVQLAAERPVNWKKLTDSKGRTYYWNSKTKESRWDLPEGAAAVGEGAPLDPYDNELIMPLHEFVEHPLAHELLHNGQLLQVLGLTNYSHDPAAAALRYCIRTDEEAQSLALDYAKERLRDMLHVGVFENLHQSLSTLATAIDLSMNGTAWRSDTANAFSYDMSDDERDDKENERPDGLDPELPKTSHEITEMLDKLRDNLKNNYPAVKDLLARNATGDLSSEEQKVLAAQDAEILEQQALVVRLEQQLNTVKVGERVVHVNEAIGYARQLLPDDRFRLNMTVGANFLECEEKATTRGKAKRERVMSNLKTLTGQTVRFSKRARALIPDTVIEEIETLNWMDMELHRYAMTLHANTMERQKQAGTYQDLESLSKPKPPVETQEVGNEQEAPKDEL